MEKIKTSLRRLKYRLKHDFFNTHNIILVVAAVLCLVWTANSINSMSRNWELAQTLAERERELKILELEVANLELENQYYASKEYQELAARDKEGKQSPGESMVYLPDNSNYAKTKHSTSTSTAVYVEPSNLSQWFSFLFGI